MVAPSMTSSTEEIIARALAASRGHPDTEELVYCEGAGGDVPVWRLYLNTVPAFRAALKVGEMAVVRVEGRWKHVKRGSLYQVLGPGKTQTSEPLGDMENVIVYRAEKDGLLWVRPTTEFYDGRFVRAMEAGD